MGAASIRLVKMPRLRIAVMNGMEPLGPLIVEQQVVHDVSFNSWLTVGTLVRPCLAHKVDRNNYRLLIQVQLGAARGTDFFLAGAWKAKVERLFSQSESRLIPEPGNISGSTPHRSSRVRFTSRIVLHLAARARYGRAFPLPAASVSLLSRYVDS
jgi:hypothetical protein